MNITIAYSHQHSGSRVKFCILVYALLVVVHRDACLSLLCVASRFLAMQRGLVKNPVGEKEYALYVCIHHSVSCFISSDSRNTSFNTSFIVILTLWSLEWFF